MTVTLYSAPGELYSEHILRCREKFNVVFPIFKSAMIRIINASIERESFEDSLIKMVLFHDLGKLTRRWQENLGKSRKLPTHAPIGAAYLWRVLPPGLKEPLSFAVAIHHTDKGLLGDNIERPDVQTILEGIVDNEGNIIWIEEAESLGENLFPKESLEMRIIDLKNMARGLRLWAKGCGLLDQHQRRLQASVAHHILKICDISAAIERKEYQKKEVRDYYGGWLMVENIGAYIDRIKKRSYKGTAYI